MKRFILSFIISLLLAVSAYAENLYVTTTGTGDGTIGDPWGISNVNNAANWGAGDGKITAGDTVYFADGTYSTCTSNIVLYPQGSGSSGSPITFKSTNKWGAVLSGCGYGVFTANEVPGKSYLTFDGFTVTGQTYYAFFLRGGTNNIVQNCYAHTTTLSTIALGYATTDNTVQGNYVTNWGSGSESGHGLYIGGINHLIQNNIIVHAGPVAGYHLKTDGHDLGNASSLWGKLINNTFVGHSVSGARPHITISFDHGTYATGYMVIRNNVFADPGYYTGTPSVIHFNSGTSPGATWIIDHNVTDVTRWYDDYRGLGDNWTYGTNWKASDGVTLANLKAQFTDYDNDDFTLAAVRPGVEWLVDLGTATDAPADDYIGTSRPLGSADDIGAYEYDSYPILTIVATDSAGAEEGTDPVTFTIYCGIQDCTGETVNYSFGGTATLNTDYNCDDEDGSIAITGATGTIICTPVDDSDPDPGETIQVNLLTGAGYGITNPNTASASITDNDAAQPPGGGEVSFSSAGSGSITYDSSGSGSWSR